MNICMVEIYESFRPGLFHIWYQIYLNIRWLPPQYQIVKKIYIRNIFHFVRDKKATALSRKISRNSLTYFWESMIYARCITSSTNLISDGKS